MSTVNHVHLVGNLGQDPEPRSGDNTPCILSVATMERWRDKNTGEKREHTDWHRVVIFNKHAAEFAERYLKKGMKVWIQGKLKTRSWDDRETGKKRYATEVVLGTFGGELKSLEAIERRGPTADDYGYSGGSQGGGRTSDASGQQRSSLADDYQGPDAPRDFTRSDFDDEIPF